MKRPDSPMPLRELAVDRGWIAALDAETPNAPILRNVKAFLLASDEPVSPHSWSEEVLASRGKITWEQPHMLCEEAATRGWLAAISARQRDGDSAGVLADLHHFMATSRMEAGSMPLLLGRWETRGQKHWYELVEEQHPKIGAHWSYRGEGSGGGFGGFADLGWNRELVFAEMARRVHMAQVIDGINMRLTENPFDLATPDFPRGQLVSRLESLPALAEAIAIQKLVSLAEIKGVAEADPLRTLLEEHPEAGPKSLRHADLAEQVRTLLSAGVQHAEIADHIEDAAPAPTWDQLNPRG